MEVLVERREPEHLFSFRWHPYAVEAGVDSSAEPTRAGDPEVDGPRLGLYITNK